MIIKNTAVLLNSVFNFVINLFDIFLLTEPVGQTVLSKKDAILENHHKSVHGYIGTTYSYNPFEDKVNECKLNKDALRSEVFGEKELFDEAVYAESKWCHDTPGLVNPDQVQINICIILWFLS